MISLTCFLNVGAQWLKRETSKNTTVRNDMIMYESAITT